MLKFVEATQLDSSDQKLKLFSANITGTLFHIQDRAAGIAVGAEYRKYDGIFTPDPLRQDRRVAGLAGLPGQPELPRQRGVHRAQPAAACLLGMSGAVRYSDYSTFGSQVDLQGWPALAADATTSPCAATTRPASARRISASCTA